MVLLVGPMSGPFGCFHWLAHVVVPNGSMGWFGFDQSVSRVGCSLWLVHVVGFMCLTHMVQVVGSIGGLNWLIKLVGSISWSTWLILVVGSTCLFVPLVYCEICIYY